ncbi:MAG: 5'-methylthioinosine phosphorylase [Flavobacteriales bacterium]|jgi:5'-methylthioinosine phosphorylase
MLAIIGGSGLYDFPGLHGQLESLETPYGEVGYQAGELNAIPFVFLSRHGQQHRLPPHKVNFKANIYALKSLGVSAILASHAVGGINKNCPPERLIIPDQIIDYTWGREHTYFDDFSSGDISHIDFSCPFNSELRDELKLAIQSLGIEYQAAACYGCTQGPRLETNAEIKRLAQDGCDVVGMTAMPEAALARELELPYVSLSFCVNWAAGINGEVSIGEIMRVIHVCSDEVKAVFEHLIQLRSI